MERINQRFEGFFLGRYDVCAPGLDPLRLGQFKVLELNGVTSEPTHIYDPRHSVRTAFRALFAHWTLAFEIGAANRAAGARVTSAGELLRAWSRARGWSRAEPTRAAQQSA